MIRIFFIVILAATVIGFPWFRNDIPNGNNVPNPCAGQSGVWQGVGHDQEPGGGSRNPFGLVRIFTYIISLSIAGLLYWFWWITNHNIILMEFASAFKSTRGITVLLCSRK